jgi:hypothetical protein
VGAGSPFYLRLEGDPPRVPRFLKGQGGDVQPSQHGVPHRRTLSLCPADSGTFSRTVATIALPCCPLPKPAALSSGLWRVPGPPVPSRSHTSVRAVLAPRFVKRQGGCSRQRWKSANNNPRPCCAKRWGIRTARISGQRVGHGMPARPNTPLRTAYAEIAPAVS